MEIKPDPERVDTALVTVDSWNEESSLDVRMPLLFTWTAFKSAVKEMLGPEPIYPRSLEISYRDLGTIGAMSYVVFPHGVSEGEVGDHLTPGVELGKQIHQFFDDQALAHI